MHSTGRSSVKMSYCRLCLTDFLSLGDYNIQNIHEKIKSVFSFEITSHPDLSEVICPDCVKTISQFYDYFCLVHQNQLKLYCQIEDSLFITECSEGGEFQMIENQLVVKNEIEDEPNEADFDKQNEPMEEEDSPQEIIPKNDNKCLPEDEIKTQPNALILEYFDEEFDDQPRKWKLENNCLYRQFDMVCDICQKVLFTYQMLKAHIKKVHAKTSYITCCDQVFVGEQIISNHFEKHKPVVKLEDPCTDNQIHGVKNVEHSVIIRLDEDDMDQNDEHINCTDAKTNKLEQNHYWKLELNIISRHLDMACKICHENQTNYQQLEKHLKKSHSRQCYITCCGLKFTSDQMLSNHFETHCPNVQTNKTKYSYTKLSMFENVLTDFAKDLEGYEPLPNMELALQDHITEKKKLNLVVDFLVQKYFPMDCDLCVKRIDNLFERRKHFQQSHPKVKFYVSCCGLHFQDRGNKMRHLNQHWKSIINEAPTCVAPRNAKPPASDRLSRIMEECRDELLDAGFIPPNSWSRPVSTDELKNLHQMQDFLIAKYLPLNCEQCDEQLSSYTERREHFRRNHSQLQFYIECCGEKIYRKPHIIFHVWQHKTNINLLKKTPALLYATQSQEDSIIEGFFKMNCRLCDYQGSSYTKLRSHVQYTHRGEEFFITCCNLRLNNRRHILAHITSHQNPYLKCEHCEEEFVITKDLEMHTRKMHFNEMKKPFKCDQCDKLFPDQKMLQSHMHKHKIVNCDLCGLEITKYALSRHRQAVHKQGREIKCPDCPNVYYYNGDFINHRKRVHSKK